MNLHRPLDVVKATSVHAGHPIVVAKRPEGLFHDREDTTLPVLSGSTANSKPITNLTVIEPGQLPQKYRPPLVGAHPHENAVVSNSYFVIAPIDS